MNKELTQKWKEIRGLAIVSIALNPVTLPEEDAQLIKDAQKNAILRDPTMAAATLAGAQADAMKSAASNTAGAMTGFMGMGMAQQAGGANMQGLYQWGHSRQHSLRHRIRQHSRVRWLRQEHGNVSAELKIQVSSVLSAENRNLRPEYGPAAVEHRTRVNSVPSVENQDHRKNGPVNAEP